MTEMSSLRDRVGRVIFRTDTPAGRAFDIILLIVILLSLVAVTLETVAAFSDYRPFLRVLEWAFTIAFTIEYVLRVYSAPSRPRYIFSFFGIVDLLAILPTYLSLLLPGAQYTLVLRSLRLLRVFRVLKLARFLDDADLLVRALTASREKVFVFLFAVLTLVLIAGSTLYMVEGPRNGFDNIPLSVYWAIVTLTTVGYGDIVPSTPLGRTISSVLMIAGYAIIAVPTGIVTTEIGRASRFRASQDRDCPRCGTRDHPSSANYCYSCGERLPVVHSD